MSESKESPGFVLNDAPRDPSYYHSPEPPVEEPPAPPAAQEDTAPRPEPRLVPHAAPPEPPPSKSRRWLPRLAMVIVFIALAALFIRLIPGAEPSPEQTVGTTESLTTATNAPTDPPGNWEDNVLAANRIDKYMTRDDAEARTVFNSDIFCVEIRTVTFLSTLVDAPDNAWDVSADHNGSVLAWVLPNGNMYDLYIAGNGGVNGALACQGLFAGYLNLTHINFGSSFHTEYATDMSLMFFGCHSLNEPNLSSFDTKNVTNMQAMFYSCRSLTELNLSNFDTEKVVTMQQMFSFCVKLTDLNLSSFNTKSVTNMDHMFDACPRVMVEDVAHFLTSNVQDYNNLLSGTT